MPMLVEETGISKVTLYDWRKQAIAKGLVVPEDGQNPENWSAEYKFAVVPKVEAVNLAAHVDHIIIGAQDSRITSVWIQHQQPLDAELGIDPHHILLHPSEIPELIRELHQNGEV